MLLGGLERSFHILKGTGSDKSVRASFGFFPPRLKGRGCGGTEYGNMRSLSWGNRIGLPDPSREPFVYYRPRPLTDSLFAVIVTVGAAPIGLR